MISPGTTVTMQSYYSVRHISMFYFIIYFIAGILYPLILFTYFICSPTPSPLVATRFFSVPISLFHFFFQISHVSEVI